MATKLYVGNMSYEMTEDGIREVFSGIGQIDSVSLITDRHTGRSKGFAFVEMANDDEAKKAIEELNGKDVDGRALSVSVARPREERGPSGPSRGGYGQRGGYGR
jgi:RNA recognition motif-containing protein